MLRVESAVVLAVGIIGTHGPRLNAYVSVPWHSTSEGEEGGFNVGFKALFGGVRLVFPSLLEHSVLMSPYVIPYNCAKFCTGGGLVGRFDFINTV